MNSIPPHRACANCAHREVRGCTAFVGTQATTHIVTEEGWETTLQQTLRILPLKRAWEYCQGRSFVRMYRGEVRVGQIRGVAEV